MDNDKLRQLMRPFNDIKSRPGRNGQSISYVEAHSIVQRLNEALAGDWSFRVLEHDVREGEVIVLGELRLGELVKQAFGGSEVTRTLEGKVVSLADDLKAAATDALKKAATLLGVGVHFSAEEPQQHVHARPKLVARPDEPDAPPNARLTRKQAEFIGQLAKANGMGRPELDELAKQRYGKSAGFLTVKEASEFIQTLSPAA